MSLLQNLILQHRQGSPAGLPSVCCSNREVLLAALETALAHDAPLLVEATSNQVDQFGGYTGMTPAAFVVHVQDLARQAGFPLERLILGGDHLGPNAWQHLPADVAMAHARVLIAAYAGAGFSKIHLDCSMSCADDPAPLPDATVAARSAELAQVAEQAAQAAGRPAPVYIVGTEVPIPGGEASLGGGVKVTRPEAAAATLEAHRAAFDVLGLHGAWQRVVALVVQPGVDFDHSSVQHYAPEQARALSSFIDSRPGLVFEAHSTDYQTEEALHALVRDHFAILKVGPGATHALREACFALAAIEDELLPPERRSQLVAVLDGCMLADPRHWKKHYAGAPAELRVLRRFALSDRSRYYWGEPAVQQALATLYANLDGAGIPLPLLSQHLPELVEAVQLGRVAPRAANLARAKVGLVLARYLRACHHNAAAALC